MIARAFFLLLLLAAATAWADLEPVAGPFARGEYRAAADLLAGTGSGARPGEDLLWAARLETDPERALSLLEDARSLQNLPPDVAVRVALEIARLESARGRHQAALRAMRGVLMDPPETVPGAVYLEAGRAARALGDLQTAREMLASIRPNDPAFVAGRGLLGEIGLQQNDPELALRYFESALNNAPAEAGTELGAGLWQALRRTGEHERADRLLADLERDHPGSLALLRIRRIERAEQEELAVREIDASAPADTVVARIEDRSGRFCVQLGAFSDRGLALAFLGRYRNEIRDLRIETVRDDRGQVLYKVRSGSFVNPALAQTEAERLERMLGVEVIVTDLTN